MFNASGVEIGMIVSLKTDSLYKASISGKLHEILWAIHIIYQLMIGLGVSSISDTWNSFMQNVKTVENYQT